MYGRRVDVWSKHMHKRWEETSPKDKLFVNRIWFSNDVKERCKNNNRNKNNNPKHRSIAEQSQTKYLHWIMFVLLKNCGVAVQCRMQSSRICYIYATLCAVFSLSLKVYANFCDCLFVWTHIRFSPMAALMQLKYSVSMAHTHTHLSATYNMQGYISSSLALSLLSFGFRLAQNFQFKYV